MEWPSHEEEPRPGLQIMLVGQKVPDRSTDEDIEAPRVGRTCHMAISEYGLSRGGPKERWWASWATAQNWTPDRLPQSLGCSQDHRPHLGLAGLGAGPSAGGREGRGSGISHPPSPRPRASSKGHQTRGRSAGTQSLCSVSASLSLKPCPLSGQRCHLSSEGPQHLVCLSSLPSSVQHTRVKDYC